MVSMKDIAYECGVSVATVSKAMNNHSDIGEATKIRIQTAASKMGYYPNSIARALKTNRTYNIGVLFVDQASSGLTHNYFSSVLEAFKVETEKKGYDITFINTNVGNGRMSYYEHCKYRNIDGVVIACVEFQKPEVIELLSSEIPVVTIDYIFDNCSSIVSDNVKGMESLIHYVYKKGHRKIAYIHGQEGSSVTADRMAGFYRTMEALGLFVPEEYVREADYLDANGSAKETEFLLQLKERPTCILYPDDTALIGGMNAIKNAGLRIPEDISIVGYDGIPVSQLIEPRLTTLKQNTKQLGIKAANALIDAIERPKTTLTQRIFVEGSILEGSSVGQI